MEKITKRSQAFLKLWIKFKKKSDQFWSSNLDTDKVKISQGLCFTPEFVFEAVVFIVEVMVSEVLFITGSSQMPTLSVLYRTVDWASHQMFVHVIVVDIRLVKTTIFICSY